ncbi:MAG: diguanylate cyclase domain-containing protein [Burkholderiaceae bacterium]
MKKLRKFIFLGSLRANLALWFCFISIALTLALAQVIGMASTAKIREQIGLKLSGLAFQVTDKLDQGMFERYREFQLISMRRMLGDLSVSMDDKRRLLEQMQQTYSSYSWIGMTDLQGKVLAATGGLLEGADVSRRPWFGNALNGIYIGDVHDAKLLASKLPNPSGEPLRFVDVAFPYTDARGRIAGVICAHMSWKWGEYVQDSVITTAVAQSGITGFIVAADGTVLLGPKDMIGSRLSLPSLNDAKKGENEFTIETWADGKEYLVGYSHTRGYSTYPGLGWMVLVRQDLATAFAPVRELQQKVLWSGFGIAFLFSLFGLFSARRISQPLRSLSRAARKLRLNEADTLGEVPESYSEINDLATSIAALVENLQNEQKALTDLNASLEQRVAERTLQLASSEARLLTITNNLPVLIAYVDAEERYRFCNKTYHDWFGKNLDQIIGSRIVDVIGEKLYEIAHDYVAQALQGKAVTYELARPTGHGIQYLKMQYLPDLAQDGSVAGAYVLGQDVSASKLQEMSLQRDLLTDALTLLPNRTAYLQELNLAIARSVRNRQFIAVMFLDVDKFKAINDTYGHEAGDKVLIEFGRRLKQSVRSTDMVARLSGDEFVVLLENLNGGEADAQVVAEKILGAIQKPINMDGLELTISTSIGVTLAAEAFCTAESLLKEADSAMYRAKHGGRNLIMFHRREAA